MPAALPPAKPRSSLSVVLTAAQAAWRLRHSNEPLPDLFVLAVRGYYRDTMGKPGVNDYGMYDDAFFVGEDGRFSAWNGNTDPSRTGWNAGAGRYMARLAPGVWTFRRLKHHASRPDGYMAYGQGSSPVTVERIRENGSIAMTETGCFGINLHRGGRDGTSSEGCCTVPAEQWTSFDLNLLRALTDAGTMTFPFIIINGPIA